MKKLIFIVVFLFLWILPIFSAPVDINRAALEEISSLPLTDDEAVAVYNLVRGRGGIKSIYELTEVISPAKLDSLKPFIVVHPDTTSSVSLRAEDFYRRLAHEGEEGGGFYELWLDMLKNPVNLNRLSFFDLLGFRGVSPQDARRIVLYRRLVGEISDIRELRRIPGLTFYSYLGLRNFVSFKEEKGRLATGSVELGIHRPELSPDEDFLAGGRESEYLKAYIKGPRFGFSGGMLLSQSGWRNGLHPDDQRLKLFAAFEEQAVGAVRLKRLILGNYNAGWGEGICFQSGGYFKPRLTGFGYDKRCTGIFYDIYSTDRRGLFGMGAELLVGDNTDGMIFFSSKKQDVIPTSPDTVAAVLELPDYIPDSLLSSSDGVILKDGIEEELVGGHISHLILGSLLFGASFWQAKYSREIVPDVSSITDREDKISTVDNDYILSSPTKDRAYRFAGLDGRMIFGNYSIGGEYSRALHTDEVSDAFVVSLYSQFNKADVLVLYRDFDPSYFNPYSRGFANYERFHGTILEKEYYLKNPLYSYLAYNSITPQSERGIYLSARARITGRLYLKSELDNWHRRADDASYSRIVVSGTYQPTRRLKINIRQKLSGRNPDEFIVSNGFEDRETRFFTVLSLTKRTELSLLLTRERMKFPPKPYYWHLPDETTSLYGGSITRSNSVFLIWRQGLSGDSELATSLGMYKGFLWNFEDGEFVVLDSDNESFRFWVSLTQRLSASSYVRFRYVHDTDGFFGEINGNIVNHRAKRAAFSLELNYFL